MDGWTRQKSTGKHSNNKSTADTRNRKENPERRLIVVETNNGGRKTSKAGNKRAHRRGKIQTIYGTVEHRGQQFRYRHR